MSIRVHPCIFWGRMKLAKLGHGPEIFHTLQGEGVSAGCPAVFIRASRCNLHCIWCDTDHTWNFAGSPWPHEKDATPGYRKHDPAANTVEMTPEAAASALLAFDCPRVVITGGEPLLQQSEFLDVIRQVRQTRPDTVFEVETNGTRVPEPELAAAVDQFNVSPKLANSGMPASLRLVPEALAAFAALPQAWFKFVVSQPADLDEVIEVRERFQLPADRILLMPEGRSADTLDRRAAWLAERCRELGWRLSDRLHVRLWGDRRGV